MSELEKVNAGLLMQCNNTAKIKVTEKEIVIDCPSCDFSCGFPKDKQRKRRLKRHEMGEVIGVDLAGVPERSTGFAVMQSLEVKTKILHSDRAIIRAINQVRRYGEPLVIIDAPLGKPLKGYSRSCERQLRKMGVKVFPCMFTQMAKLTERGIILATNLRKKGYGVLETYPHSVQRLMGIAPKRKGKEKLREGLIKYGIAGDVFKPKISDHELDAITCCIVGKLYREGKTVSLGNEKEGFMIIPSLIDLAKLLTKEGRES